MAVKVKMRMLNIKAGTILDEGDKHYESFVNWAEKKSKRNGAMICEFICIKEPGLEDLGKAELVELVDEFNGANPDLAIEYKGNASKTTLIELLEAAQANLEELEKELEESEKGFEEEGDE